MATFTVTFDGTRLSNADTASAGGTWSDGVEPDFVYQGAASISEQIKTTEDAIYFALASARDMTNEICIFKGLCVNKDAIDSVKGWGFGFANNTPASPYHYCVIGRAIDYPLSTGGWVISACQPSATLTGLANNIVGHSNPGYDISTTQRFYVQSDFSVLAKAENVMLDAIDVYTIGTGLTATGGDGGDTDGTFQDFIDFDDGNVDNRYGIVSSDNGILYVSAFLQIGNSTQATAFTDSNRVLVFPYHFVDNGALGLEFDISNTSTTIDITSCVFNGRGNPNMAWDIDNRPDLLVTGSVGVVNVKSSSFSSFNDVTLNGNCAITDCTFDKTGIIVADGANLQGTSVSNFQIKSDIICNYTGVSSNTSSATNLAYNDIPCGNANTGRQIWIAASMDNSTVVNSVTVDGANATIIAQANVDAGNTATALMTDVIAYIDDTSGTTCNVVINTAATVDDGMVMVYECYNINTTAFDTAANNSPGGETIMNVPCLYSPGGIAFYIQGTENNNNSYANITKRYISQTFFGSKALVGGVHDGSKEIFQKGGSNPKVALVTSHQANSFPESSAVVWDLNLNTDGKLDGMSFTKGDVDHHALELGNNSPTSVTLNDITFSGYGANDAIDAAIWVRRTTGSVTINTSGVSGLTYKSDGATVSVVADPVTVRVNTVDVSGSDVNSVRVLLKAADSSGPFPYQESVTITNSGTTATVNHSAHGLLTNDKVEINGASHWENNGVFQITVANTTHYTYTLPSDPGSSPTGTITSTFVALEGLTSVGTVSASRVYSANQNVTGVARKSSAADNPKYKSAPLNGTITSTGGFEQTATMISDQ